MPDIATVLRQEILRLARKEVKLQTDAIRKMSTQQRREIAELKRSVADLSKQVSAVRRPSARIVADGPIVDATSPGRFSAKGLRSHRERLGLSASHYAKLLGVSAQTIYHWEQGTSRPRDQQLATLIALRPLGKREMQRRLDALDE
jgi:DNA-binding XRE family transcriptional regulator